MFHTFEFIFEPYYCGTFLLEFIIHYYLLVCIWSSVWRKVWHMQRLSSAQKRVGKIKAKQVDTFPCRSMSLSSFFTFFGLLSCALTTCCVGWKMTFNCNCSGHFLNIVFKFWNSAPFNCFIRAFQFSKLCFKNFTKAYKFAKEIVRNFSTLFWPSVHSVATASSL